MAKDMFKKYIWIVNKLYTTGGISYKELAKAWENSIQNDEGSTIPKRTFDDYRNAIENTFDLNISCDASDGYKYKLCDAESLRKDTVKSWLLNSFAVNNCIQESRRLKQRILFERIPSGNESLMHIIQAMQENKTIRLTYQSFHHSQPSTFPAEPYCVKVFKQRWYMVAHNPEKNCIGIYALDRIQRLELADETFTFPETFDAEAYFRDSYGIMVTPEELDVETIRIKVSDKNNKRKYLRLLPLHHSQEETEKHSDYSVFTYRLYPTYDFFQEILSHGGEVEVLSPEWVRKEFKELIEDMLRQYLP